MDFKYLSQQISFYIGDFLQTLIKVEISIYLFTE